MGKIILTHPLGNPNARENVKSLVEHELLYGVQTIFSYSPKSLLGTLVDKLPQQASTHLKSELSRRNWLPETIRPLFGCSIAEFILSGILRVLRGSKAELLRVRVANALFQLFDKHTAALIKQKYTRQSVAGVYCYEDAAYQTFQAAKSLGILCLYDLPALHHQFVFDAVESEAKLRPEFISCFAALDEPKWKIESKRREIELADHIFVASSLAEKALINIGVSKERVSVVPYGAPIAEFSPKRSESPNNKFTALYVGRISPQKGVHYLIEAWEMLQLKNASLQLVGSDHFPPMWLQGKRHTLEHTPSVPHHELLKHYQQANVFVFPSLADGFGLVLLEAMACGVPVIATDRTGAPDIIRDGIDGFIVPARDSDALQKKILWCYENPEATREMGRVARLRAEEFSWQNYRERFAAAVTKVLTELKSQSKR